MKRLIKTLFIGVILGMLAMSPALADLTSETYKTVFLPDGGTDEFDFDFKVFDEDDLEVILVLESTLAETTLVLGAGAGKYTVSGLSSSGGTVTTGTTYSALYTLVVRRNQALKQEIDYVSRGPFSTTVLEQGLDQIVMMIQDNKEEIDRSIKVGAIEISAPDYLATVAAGAAASVEAQEAAETAATNAETAETNAGNSATSAAASAASIDLTEPDPIGETTPNSGAFTTLTATGDIYTAAWTDYSGTSTVVGWTSFTTKEIFTKKIGKMVFVSFEIAGTSNAVSTSFTLPYAAGAGMTFWGAVGYGENDGTQSGLIGCTLTPASSQLIFLIAGSSGAWTASGGKTVNGQFWYEAE